MFAAIVGVVFGIPAAVAFSPSVGQVVTLGVFCTSFIGSIANFNLPGLASTIALPVGSGNQSRSIYNALKAKYPNKTVTGSYLRSEVDLSATQGSIRFPILVNDTQANINERRLNVGDAFMVTELGIYLYKTPTGESRAGQTLNSFPNSILFSRGTGAEAKALMQLYNGLLSIAVDRNELLPAVDLYQFYNAGVAQQGVLTAASGTNNAYIANSFDKSSLGMDLTPSVAFAGNVVNDVVLTPAVGGDMSGTSSVNTIVLFARGFLIQGGAELVKKGGI
jgi:hypothetical protein